MVLRPSPTRSLRDYLLDFNELGIANFKRRHSTSMLVLRQQNLGHESVREFETAVVSRDKPNSVLLAMDAQANVFPLIKRRDAPFSDHISVGRTRSSDVCLNFAEVSKFHAYFRPIASEAKRFTLTDAGATNGTFVNTRRLQGNEAIAIDNGMLVRFGSCELTFFTIEGFSAYVAARSRGSGPHA